MILSFPYPQTQQLLSSKADPPLGPGPHEHTQFKPELSSPPTPPLSQHKETMEDILDDTLVSTKHGKVQKYLDKWKNGPVSDGTWITRDEL